MSFVKIQLNEDSKTPLYHQMSEQIFSAIENRKLKPGDPLPSERELCETYGVSRGTVRQAIQALANLGYITRKQGKGTIIKHPTLNHDLIGDFSFGAGMLRQGLRVKSIVIFSDVIVGRKSINGRLRLENKALLTKILRIRCANDEPWIIEYSYLSAEEFPGIEQLDFTSRLLVDYLSQDYGTRIGRVEAFIEPTVADEDHSALLGIKVGSPALVLDRILYDVKGSPVVYSQAFVRGDRCRYYFKTKP